MPPKEKYREPNPMVPFPEGMNDPLGVFLIGKDWVH